MFLKEDLQSYKQLKMIISQGKYEVKGEAIVSVALLLRWFDGLEKLIEVDLRNQKLLAEKKMQTNPSIKKGKGKK